jgi:hypothetical protein
LVLGTLLLYIPYAEVVKGTLSLANNDISNASSGSIYLFLKNTVLTGNEAWVVLFAAYFPAVFLLEGYLLKTRLLFKWIAGCEACLALYGIALTLFEMDFSLLLSNGHLIAGAYIILTIELLLTVVCILLLFPVFRRYSNRLAFYAAN